MSKQVTLMTDAIPYQEFAKLIGKSTGAVRRMIDSYSAFDVVRPALSSKQAVRFDRILVT